MSVLPVPPLYLIEILHQTTTAPSSPRLFCCCILSKFYIKPQPSGRVREFLKVVSYRNSTSNHNISAGGSSSSSLYLIEILHQTTTACPKLRRRKSCILSKFYIKPQLEDAPAYVSRVVSYRNSTSNHNMSRVAGTISALYLIEILHQTTTENHQSSVLQELYLIEILHQTTTTQQFGLCISALYLIEILHQTTTY